MPDQLVSFISDLAVSASATWLWPPIWAENSIHSSAPYLPALTKDQKKYASSRGGPEDPGVPQLSRPG